MTDGSARFSDELLADLHAGVLPPDAAAQLWPQVYADPEASAVIEALDRVSSTLSGLGSAGLSHQGESMPSDVAARLDSLFESTPDVAATATVLPLRPTSGRRTPHRWQWLAAACALVAALGAAGIWVASTDRSDDPVQAQPSNRTSTPPLVLGNDLSADTLLAAMGRHDAQGTLSTDRGLRACLTAIGIDRKPLGSTAVLYQNRPGALILAAGPEKGSITAVIVNPDCAPGNADVRAQRDI
ncbi:MAG: hypothetical protein LLG14_16125 [Nocardiaceae bacterium]|nr:hypothetical protein [Nocardiaceae bacterium]